MELIPSVQNFEQNPLGGIVMNISIIAVGSRGDLQPYLALGLGFKNAGHHVTIVAFEMYESWVQDYGLEFLGFKGDIKSWLNSPAGLDWLEAGANPIRFMKGLRLLLNDFLEDLWDKSMQCAAESDLLLYTPLGLTAKHVAEKYFIPALPVFYVPHYPTSEFPTVLSPPSPIQFGWLNRISHYGSEWGLWQSCKAAIQKYRKDAGLAPYRPSQDRPFTGDYPYLMGYSDSVSPRANDWPERVQATGYWFLDQTEGYQPPKELMDFLNSDEKPVYIGFGSMTGRKNLELTTQILEGLRQTRTRAILMTGWGALTKENLPDGLNPDQVFFLENAPHDWLFLQVKAVVHHGGAGTTSSGFKAGVPQWIIPHFADQYFWGERVHQLGCGPTPVCRKKVHSRDWIQNLADLSANKNYESAASTISHKIAKEDGVQNAVQIIENWYQLKTNFPNPNTVKSEPSVIH